MRLKVVETVRETSLGPRSSFTVYRKGWFGWWDLSSTDCGGQLGSMAEVETFLRCYTTPPKVIVHNVQ